MRRGEAVARRAGRAAAVGALVAQRRAGAARRDRPARGGARAARRRRRGGLAAHGLRLGRLPRDVVVLLTQAGWNSCVACGNGSSGMASGSRSGSALGLLVEPGALDAPGSGSGSGSGRARSTRNGSSLGAAGSGGCALRAENVSGVESLTATGGAFGGGPGALFRAALRGCRLATRHVLRLHCDGRGRRTRRAVSARRP